MPKIGFYTKIDEDLLRRFKEYVLAKHGSLKGYIGLELENALKRLLEGEIEPEIDLEREYSSVIHKIVEYYSRHDHVRYIEIVEMLAKHRVPPKHRPKLAEIISEELHGRGVYVVA